MPRVIAVVVEKRGCRKHCAVVVSALEYQSEYGSWVGQYGRYKHALGSTRATRLPKPGSIINMKRFLFGEQNET